MVSEKTLSDFRFKSTFVATIVTRCFGLVLLWFSFEFLDGWRSPTWNNLPYLVIVLPLGLSILAAGSMFLFYTCEIEIVDGRLHFRRFLRWQSVPLESITSIRSPWAPGCYLKVDYAGKHSRIIFSPEDFKPRAHPLPVISFLRDLCRLNVGARLRDRL